MSAAFKRTTVQRILTGEKTVAPGVCNAIFGLTGRRIRKLPLEHDVAGRA